MNKRKDFGNISRVDEDVCLFLGHDNSLMNT